jgi:hypothetical protein
MNSKLLRQLALKPKAIFFIDGSGALVTAFLLFAILRTYNNYVGLPESTLSYLSTLAAFFCIYSITCFFLLKDNWQPFLRIIIMANLLYCFLTISLLIYHHRSITIIGTAYFSAEILIIFVLIFIEVKTLKVSNKAAKKE